jgi:hypothetical protein
MQKPEEERPLGVTVLMAIYGEMAIYGQGAAGVARLARLPLDSRIDFLIPLPRFRPLG